MKMDWKKYNGKMLSVTMHENYGLTLDPKSDTTIFEIVFKTGRLSEVFEDGLLLETERESQQVMIFIPYSSVKCIEIFNL